MADVVSLPLSPGCGACLLLCLRVSVRGGSLATSKKMWGVREHSGTNNFFFITTLGTTVPGFLFFLFVFPPPSTSPVIGGF